MMMPVKQFSILTSHEKKRRKQQKPGRMTPISQTVQGGIIQNPATSEAISSLTSLHHVRTASSNSAQAVASSP